VNQKYVTPNHSSGSGKSLPPARPRITAYLEL